MIKRFWERQAEELRDDDPDLLPDEGDPIVLPVSDVIDLHTFKPKEVRDLLEEYFQSCMEEGIFSIRIIHGKGCGIMKQNVRHFLKNHQTVVDYHDAPPEAGGWGATLVKLKSDV